MKKLDISSIRVFGNVMVTLIIGSQILKTFCAVFGSCARKNFIQRIFRWIQLQTAPSKDAWSMAEMLWRSIHEYLLLPLPPNTVLFSPGGLNVKYINSSKIPLFCVYNFVIIRTTQNVTIHVLAYIQLIGIQWSIRYRSYRDWHKSNFVVL